MPKSKPICIVIDVAGQARQYDLNNEKFIGDELYEAVPVQPHGGLIDADVLRELCEYPHWCVWLSEIDDAPTIIPAEEC